MANMAGPTGGDLRLFDRATESDAPLVSTPFTEWGARLSPDNRVLAFVSNETGRWEVHVQPFPGPGRQISTEGGTEAVWSRDGRELFYRNGSRMMAVAIDTASLSVGETTTLFDVPSCSVHLVCPPTISRRTAVL
jgi:Tol biopolymer transport system component